MSLAAGAGDAGKTDSARVLDPALSHCSVAIFSARESIDTLARCIEAARVAVLPGGREAVIDVLVNGQRALAEAAATCVTAWVTSRSAAERSCVIRIWFIALGDKAHAWNVYLHHVRERQANGPAFFIDGYVELRPDALLQLSAALAAAPNALAATGVPSVGHSARALRDSLVSEGGLHGNLFALRDSTVTALQDAGFRLPLGLYRTDATLGAALNFRLDPSMHRWDRSAVVVQPSATWQVQPRRWWSPSDAAAHLKRLLRQSQGLLEVAAVRQHLAVDKAPPQALPGTARELVEQWIAAHPAAARTLMRAHPLTRHGLRQLRRPRDWSQATHAPALLLMIRPQ